MTDRAMHIDQYDLVYAHAERNARHLLFVGNYNGKIDRLIEDTRAATVHSLPYADLQAVSARDLSDVCLHAAYEQSVAQRVSL